jgi:hypothetical protein
MAMEGAAKPCPKCYCRMLAMEVVAKPEHPKMSPLDVDLRNPSAGGIQTIQGSTIIAGASF